MCIRDIPNTDHLKGIPAAAAAGIVAGDPDKELEVIAHVTEDQVKEMREFLDKTPISVEHVDNGLTFEIVVTLFKGDDYAKEMCIRDRLYTKQKTETNIFLT